MPMAADEQGHFKELESLLRLLEQPKPDDDVAAAPPEEDEEDGAIVLAEDGDAMAPSSSSPSCWPKMATRVGGVGRIARRSCSVRRSCSLRKRAMRTPSGF